MTRRSTVVVVLAVALLLAAVTGIALLVADDEAAEPAPPCIVAITGSHPTIIDGGYSVKTIATADGTTTLLTGDEVANDPDISPDGRRIAYVHVIGDYESSGPERTELWTMGIDGSAPTRVVTDGDYQEAPAWSPDGERIAFARQDRRGGMEVVVVPVSGGEATVVARPTADDRARVTSIDWSPDGRQLAYLWSTAGLGDDGTEVRVVGLDGSDPRTLAEQPRLASVDWHPDGSSLLVSAFDDADLPLQLIDVADGTTTALAHRGDLARWSPDGAGIYAVVAVVGESSRWALVELPGPDDPDGAVRTIGPADFPSYGMSVGPGC